MNEFISDIYNLIKRYNLTFFMIIIAGIATTIALMPETQDTISKYDDLKNVSSYLTYSTVDQLSQAELLDLRNETTKAIVSNNSMIPLGENEFYVFDGIIESGNASLFTIYNTQELNLEKSNNYTTGNFTVKITEDFNVSIFRSNGQYW